MRALVVGVVLLAGFSPWVAADTAALGAPTPTDYPLARRETVVERYHGVDVSDPYRWMENLRDPELAVWIDAQNARSTPRLDGSPRFEPTRRRLRAIADVYPAAELGVTVKRQTIHRELVDGHLHLFVRVAGERSPRRLVDGATLGEGMSLKAFVPSPDGVHVAYVVGPAGTDWGEIRIRHVETGGDVDEALPHVRFEGPLGWSADGRGVLYRRFAPPRAGRREAPAEGAAIWLHRIGEPVRADRLVYALPDAQRDWNLAFGLPGDRRRLFVHVERGPWGEGHIGGARAGVSMLELDARGAPRRNAALRRLTKPDAAYRVVHVDGGWAWLFTDRDAPRRRVVRIELANPAPARWREVVPESEAVLTRVEWFDGRLVVHGFENVQSAIRLFEADGTAAGRIPLPGAGVVQEIAGTATSPRVSLLYSGLLQAPVVIEHDLERGTTVKGAPARTAPDLGGFEVQQEWFASRDGTRVPMFVVSRRGLVRDGSHATLLHGYGASNTAVLPFFREDVVAWLQMGGVYAIANLRGGGEFGRAWYEAAIRERKQTTFDDMLAAAEHLVGAKWTSADRLGIVGASNGGLLVAATMLQRPDRFRAVIADVPVTDALRRHLAGNGPQQVDQWGTPDLAAVFTALRAYSPVHNVAPGTCYPATFVSTSRDDDRMPPWHAYKFVATLQAAQGCDRPILLHVRDRGGHGGGSLDGWIDLTARQLVFAADELGL